MPKIAKTKLSIDMNNYFDVTGTIDTENRKLSFNISNTTFKELFNFDYTKMIFNTSQILNQLEKVAVLTEDGKYYSCIGCIFSIHSNDKIYFSSANINFILENILTDDINIKIHKLTFKTYYIGHSIHSAYINNYTFNYNSNISISFDTYITDDFHIDISVKSKKLYDYNKLSDILYTVIEMLFLIFR